MWYRAIMCLIAAILTIGASPRYPVFPPLTGSPDYVTVAALHTNSQDANNTIEPYKLTEVLMAHARTVSLAYVEARGRDDLIIFEEVVMRKPGSDWRRIWAWGINGTNECAQGIAHYTKIIRYVKRQGINSRKLLPGFEQKVKNARKGIECEFGDFDSDDAALQQ